MKSPFTVFITTLLTCITGYSQTYTAHPENPILPLSFPNPGIWNDPCVLKQGDTYLMYLSSKNGGPDIFDGEVVPYLMTSEDGINWELYDSVSLLTTSTDSAAWDFVGVETPSVIIFEGTYHMYYTAIALNGQFAIGHATSADGLIWNKEDIVIVPSNLFDDWMSYIAAEPGAVVYNDSIYLYFTGIGNRFDAPSPAGKAVIGLATSGDGFVFNTPQQVLEQGVLYPAADDYYGYSTPFPVVINDTIHLFYDVAREIPEWIQVALHHAYSADGVTNFIEDNSSIFVKSDFDWTKREIRAPAALFEDGTMKLWFCGDDIFETAQWGIGYAWSDNFSVETNNFIVADNYFYPNPANQFVTLTENNRWDYCMLTDITGKQLIRINQINNSTLNTSALNEGMYILHFYKNNQIIQANKLLIMH